MRRRTQLLRCFVVRFVGAVVPHTTPRDLHRIARGTLPADSEGESDRRSLHTGTSERFNAAAV